jgi:hypothetical protein
MFTDPPTPHTRQTLLAAARAHAHGDRHAEMAVLVAEAHSSDVLQSVSAEAVGEAVDCAQQAGDARLESAALDALLALRVSRGEVVEAAAIGRRRVELLTSVRLDPATVVELKDALYVAAITATGAGDLAGALRLARQQTRLPYLEGERDLSSEVVLAPAALAGAWDEVIAAAELFRRAWRQADCRRAPGWAIGPAAVAMVHGLRGDESARADWLEVLASIRGVPDHLATQDTGYGETFDAMVLLHQGRPEEALRRLAPEPGAIRTWWHGQLFSQWHLALRAEAAVLAEHPDAEDHVAQADHAMAGNPIATALVLRAKALRSGDDNALVDVIAAFEAGNCRYQATRTLTLASGGAADERAVL